MDFVIYCSVQKSWAILDDFQHIGATIYLNVQIHNEYRILRQKTKLLYNSKELENLNLGYLYSSQAQPELS